MTYCASATSKSVKITWLDRKDIKHSEKNGYTLITKNYKRFIVGIIYSNLL